MSFDDDGGLIIHLSNVRSVHFSALLSPLQQ